MPQCYSKTIANRYSETRVMGKIDNIKLSMLII